MKKVTIRQSSENVVYVTLNGKVIYIDDSIKGELTIDAWDEEPKNQSSRRWHNDNNTIHSGGTKAIRLRPGKLLGGW